MKDIIEDVCKIFSNLFDDSQFANIDCISCTIFEELQFSFVDLCMGIIPESLYIFIDNIFNCQKLTQHIISLFLYTIFIDFYDQVWKPHCKKAIEEERLAGISALDKKEKQHSNDINFYSNRISHRSEIDIIDSVQNSFLSYVNFNNSIGYK